MVYINYYIKAFQNYFNAEGRATRSEFWYFFLFYIIGSLIFGILDTILAATLGIRILVALYALATIIPFITVLIRRLHDIGKSGWWMFIPIVPIAGFIAIIVFLVMDSSLGENKYGPNPKEPNN